MRLWARRIVLSAFQSGTALQFTRSRTSPKRISGTDQSGLLFFAFVRAFYKKKNNYFEMIFIGSSFFQSPEKHLNTKLH